MRVRMRPAIAVGRVEAEGGGEAAVARPEGGEGVAAIGDHRHAQRLQHLQRLRHVEQRLRSRRDHRHRRAGELGEVGGDVEARLRPAVDAADTAGGEDADAGEVGRDHGGGDGGGAGAAGLDGIGEVGGGKLQRLAGLAPASPGGAVEADADPAVDHRDRRRHRTGGAHLGLDGERGVEIVRPRHAVADDGGFQRHHRSSVGECPGDLGESARCRFTAPPGGVRRRCAPTARLAGTVPRPRRRSPRSAPRRRGRSGSPRGTSAPR